MGFMTVVFLLNDFGHTIEASPHATASLLTYPPMSDCDRASHLQRAEHVATQHGESMPHSQAVQVFPTFHADNRKFYMAGGNCMVELTPLRVRKDRKTGRKVVVLDLPDYLQDKKRIV